MADELQLMRPVWADPRWMLIANDYSLNSVPITVPGSTQVARSNPTRWAIGFSLGRNFSGGFPIEIVPGNPVQFNGWVMSNQAIWFNVFTYGPMVTGEWWAFTTGAYNLSVYEATIQG